jgi:hypothetical protein
VNSSGSLTCGDNRLLFTFLDADNAPVAAPDRPASIAVFDRGRDGTTPTETKDGSFVWGIENERGFYTAHVTFPEAGEWGAEFTAIAPDGHTEKLRLTFQVQPTTPVVRVGQKAPASDTPTGESVGGALAKISTDIHPDPGFYKTSVKAALAAHRPFVLVFATPKFCVTAQCGPTLDRVKPLIAAHPAVDFIHVEPYEMAYKDGGLQPVLGGADGNQLVPNQWTFEWGLLSEPYVFVVDRDGVVAAAFEGVVATSELEAAIKAVE